MHKLTASLALLTSLTLTNTLHAGPWGTQLRPTQTEIPRLALDTAYTVRKNGSAGPYQLYNHGAGYSIAGHPKGDSIIGLSSTGRESNLPLMTMHDRGKHLSLDAESTLYCHFPERPTHLPAYSVFRPISIDPPDNVASTRIELTLGVQDESITRLRVARNYSSVVTGFNSTLNDHLLLEISNGVLWAWPTQLGYTNNPADRRKIASMTTTAADNPTLAPYTLEIDLGRPGESCSVNLTRVNSPWLHTFQQPLPSQYCNQHNQNNLVIAVEVDQDYATGSAANQAGGLCLSSMEVVSTVIP